MAAHAATRGSSDGLILESGFPSTRALLRASPLMFVLSSASSYRFPAAQLLRRRGNRPVLVLHGDHDRVVPIKQGWTLFETMSEPKQFVAIPGGDHNDATPADPATYWQAVERFVAGLVKQ